MKSEQPLFKPIQNKRTFEEISLKIKELVFKGRLKSGDKLPSETELARQYGVGRQTVREALRVLEISGFISTHKGGKGGAVIEDTILTAITNSFVDAIHMKKLSMDAVNAVRLDLERLIIKHAVKNADEEDIKSLQVNIEEARIKLDHGIDARKENFDFHKLLAQATKNHVFVIIMESIMTVLAGLISRYQLDINVQKFIAEEHQNMLDALKNNEPIRAYNHLEDYLRIVQDSYKDIATDEQGLTVNP